MSPFFLICSVFGVAFLFFHMFYYVFRFFFFAFFAVFVLCRAARPMFTLAFSVSGCCVVVYCFAVFLDIR